MKLTNFGDLEYRCPFCGAKQPSPNEDDGCVHYAYAYGFGELLGAGAQLLALAPGIFEAQCIFSC